MKYDQGNPYPFSFELVFVNDPLLGPSAHIVVRFCSKDEDGTTYLTPECKTPDEWHHQMDRFQAELEVLRNRGIRNFIEAMNGLQRKRRKQK